MTNAHTKPVSGENPSSLFSAHLPIPSPAISLYQILSFALLGGFLLNLMPCVFPVISLKILSFIHLSDKSRRLTVLHGMLFSLGVLISFWILGGTLLFLRMGGLSIGWGFQMQQPLFVATLAFIFVLCALALFDVFHMGMFSFPPIEEKTSSSPLLGSIFSGIIATIVATPCIGPFLGPALGASIALDAKRSFLVYTCIGLGMSLPYLLFSFFPILMRFLPKPGVWLFAFKKIMGFFMLFATSWLVWVLGTQTNNHATFSLLLGLISLSFATWIYGNCAVHNKERKRLLSRTISSIFFLALAVLLIFKAATGHRQFLPTNSLIEDSQSTSQIWRVFSPDDLQALREQNTPVFIDFTASWCLLCQSNKPALYSSKVQEEFKNRGVVAMRADWSTHDPVITKELEKFGRAGVPFYLLYGKDPSQEPIILPQILTEDLIIDSLEKIE